MEKAHPWMLPNGESRRLLKKLELVVTMTLPMLHLHALHESMLRAARPLEHLIMRALTNLIFLKKLRFELGSVCFDTYPETLLSDVAPQLKP